MNKLTLGPLLAIEEENTYSICFVTKAQVQSAVVIINNQRFNAVKAGDTFSGIFWRCEVKLNAPALITYNIETDTTATADANNRSSWQFHITSTAPNPKLAYASCNGFSSFDLLKNCEHPYALWEQLIEQHNTDPFNMLIMGGDQVYADEIWTAVPGLKEWASQKMSKQVQQKSSKTLEKELDKFYEYVYFRQWNQESVSLALASIPTVMMWDDHDIFDGWGSYPLALQSCEVYTAIFSAAKKYFNLFQLRQRPASRLLDPNNNAAYGLHYHNYTILALDHRSQRSLNTIMSETQWQSVISWLKNTELRKNLLVLSAVPVVYRDFGSIEHMVDLTPWTEELTDDLKDHWRAKDHQGERLRLIQQLLSELRFRTDRLQKDLPDPQNTLEWHNAEAARTVILSGDVHVGALGVITDRRLVRHVKVHQIVSSGIVHPPPTPLEWAGILATTNDRNEFLNEDKTIEARMLTPVGSRQYIRARNFTSLREGNDKKLWVNWIDESKDKAEYPLD